jgi:uncharacterized protein YbbK (DUF523 family)
MAKARRASDTLRPIVVVSECLLGERCRYDGKIISAPWIQELAAVVRFVPVCPEVGIGLEVPRFPIRLVETAHGIRLIQAPTGKDLTRRMRSFCRKFLAEHKPDGFILTARSPSCAVRDAAVYDDSGEVTEETRPGLFASDILRRFPGLPVEDEERLAGPSVLLRFVGRPLDVRP